MGQSFRKESSTRITEAEAIHKTKFRRRRRRRPLREIQIVDSDSEDQTYPFKNNNNIQRALSYYNGKPKHKPKICTQNEAFYEIKNNQNIRKIMYSKNDDKHSAEINKYIRLKNDSFVSDDSYLQLSADNSHYHFSPSCTRNFVIQHDFQNPYAISNDIISLNEDKDLSEIDLEDAEKNHNNSQPLTDERKTTDHVLETEPSLDLPNSQTGFDDTIIQPSPVTSNNFGNSGTYKTTNQSSFHGLSTKSHRMSTRQNDYVNFNQLMRALARKYWRSPNSRNTATNTSLDVYAPTTQPNSSCIVTTRHDTDDDTFTNVTELSRRDNSLFCDKTLNGQKLRAGVNRMQPIAEEGSSQDSDNVNNDKLIWMKGDQSPTVPRRPTSRHLGSTSPDTRFFIEADKDEEDGQENEENADESDDDFIDHNTQINEEQESHPTSLDRNFMSQKSMKATIIKLSMPVTYIRERMTRPGIKILCYRFWVDDNFHTWSAFHCQKDRRIESIGRATSCHIRLRAKKLRQPSGFIKQEVVVYAPSLCALEKCCNLFDDKFPAFYASAEFHKVKQWLQSD